MKAEKLIKDPVFHLNLLLWMSKEQPLDNYRVNPFFFQHGYRIIYIEKPFILKPNQTLLVTVVPTANRRVHTSLLVARCFMKSWLHYNSPCSATLSRMKQ